MEIVGVDDAQVVPVADYVELVVSIVHWRHIPAEGHSGRSYRSGTSVGDDTPNQDGGSPRRRRVAANQSLLTICRANGRLWDRTHRSRKVRLDDLARMAL